MTKIINQDKIDQAKKRIIKLFLANVKGKTPNTLNSNIRHDGKGGHWLEKQMGIAHNASNSPDIEGFEMKNHTPTKTTFGDWSPDYKIFSDKSADIDRSAFLKIFGGKNKDGRFSWSGKPCPKIGGYNTFGQILKVDSKDNIFAVYSFKKDQRPNKAQIVPKRFQKNNLVLAKWEKDSLKLKLENKFNKLGWFKCLKNVEGVYVNIVFGKGINFDTWIKGVREGFVFFDSGMFDGNPRPYSQWRGNNKYWESLEDKQAI